MRPSFHFTAASVWINDPHGITPYDGGYHLFFQHTPASLVWRPDCHWGHAIGRDLFGWTELPAALAPGEGDDGIWTGALVTDDAGATRILHTSTVQPDIGIGRIRVATQSDPDKNERLFEVPAKDDPRPDRTARQPIAKPHSVPTHAKRCSMKPDPCLCSTRRHPWNGGFHTQHRLSRIAPRCPLRGTR